MCKLFCSHQWSDIGPLKQKCQKCNKVRMIECTHIWETTETWNTFIRGTTIQTGRRYVRKCTICGEQDIKTLDFY